MNACKCIDKCIIAILRLLQLVSIDNIRDADVYSDSLTCVMQFQRLLDLRP